MSVIRKATPKSAPFMTPGPERDYFMTPRTVPGQRGDKRRTVLGQYIQNCVRVRFVIKLHYMSSFPVRSAGWWKGIVGGHAAVGV